jgi:hypothetical protein
MSTTCAAAARTHGGRIRITEFVIESGRVLQRRFPARREEIIDQIGETHQPRHLRTRRQNRERLSGIDRVVDGQREQRKEHTIGQVGIPESADRPERLASLLVKKDRPGADKSSVQLGVALAALFKQTGDAGGRRGDRGLRVSGVQRATNVVQQPGFGDEAFLKMRTVALQLLWHALCPLREHRPDVPRSVSQQRAQLVGISDREQPRPFSRFLRLPERASFELSSEHELDRGLLVLDVELQSADQSVDGVRRRPQHIDAPSVVLVFGQQPKLGCRQPVAHRSLGLPTEDGNRITKRRLPFSTVQQRVNDIAGHRTVLVDETIRMSTAGQRRQPGDDLVVAGLVVETLPGDHRVDGGQGQCDDVVA